ncbi:hypothetical protein JAAARDRAFT_192038 [Jaapia argillacea MUCL 33604]|uniref:BTB domain-containing protein n=1 Tax=Jaapia argillacea MUCL 33604 TaxID=933084 RepID=A0A067PXV9_9AGAM|nr:hypothetical protein JAAARDRAFT_192038 [Jaapia argillacea MUCL 33604]
MSTPQSEQPPLKRPRTDEVVPLTPHPDLWYDDGSIIVIAQSTMFKVYKGRLSQCSSVFQDMFCLSSSSTQELLDGCPMVHLSDSAQDVTHMLRAIHDWQQVVIFSVLFNA